MFYNDIKIYYQSFRIINLPVVCSFTEKKGEFLLSRYLIRLDGFVYTGNSTGGSKSSQASSRPGLMLFHQKGGIFMPSGNYFYGWLLVMGGRMSRDIPSACFVKIFRDYWQKTGGRREWGGIGNIGATMMYFSNVYFTAHSGLKIIIHNVSRIKETRTIYCSGG